MAPQSETHPVEGTAGSEADPLAKDYPGVPFNSQHFHKSCALQNYSNVTEVRICDLSSLPDLNQGNSEVRDKIVEFMNHLIDLGVAGGESVKREEYTSLGTVTDFTHSVQIGMVFRKIERDLSTLKVWGPQSGFLPSRYSFVFVDNHDNQRGHGSGGDMILNYKTKNLYTKAVAFMLAHPHGGKHPRIMSSYYFDDPSQGPPHDNSGNILSRGIDDENQCTNGLVCEHPWAPIANMIQFRAATEGTVVRSFTNIAKD